MAASCHLRKSEFSRLFKRAFRKTPVEFLSNFRIQRSLELLCCKQYTDTKVASMRVGFSDSSYYSEVFRKVMLCFYQRLHRARASLRTRSGSARYGLKQSGMGFEMTAKVVRQNSAGMSTEARKTFDVHVFCNN